jgi:hypothetical protein
MQKTAIVILTHFYDANIERMFNRLRAEAPAWCEVFLAVNRGAEALSMPEAAGIGDALFLCNTQSLVGLGYPVKCKPEGWTGKGWTSNPGNADLILISFYKAHPGYAHYWAVEYDVHYEGSWSFFFERFAASRADLIGTTICDGTKNPRKSTIPPPFHDAQGNMPGPRDIVQGFYPIARLSRAALDAIIAGYQAGWGGHYELTWGTIIKRAGLGIEDIGGHGEYVKPHNRNAFYFSQFSTYSHSPGTFVFRPSFAGALPYRNTLWHPVKPAGQYVNWHVLLLKGNPAKTLWEMTKPQIWKIVIRLWFLFCWRPAETSPPPADGR